MKINKDRYKALKEKEKENKILKREIPKETWLGVFLKDLGLMIDSVFKK